MGKGQSTEHPEKLKLEAPRGILWAYNRCPATETGLLQKLRAQMPTASIQHSQEKEVAVITVNINAPERENAEALLQRAQRSWRWQAAIREPVRLLEIIRNLTSRAAG